MLMLLATAIGLSLSVHAQDCKPVDFGNGSIVCECNSTYCDYYPDPKPPNNGDFIWYVSSKSGLRLYRSDGKISDKPKDGYMVRINPNKEYQIMEGFGGAFTDAACINIKKLSQKSQDNLLRAYFSTDGSNYNLGRVPIAGTDFSTRAYTYDDVDGDTELEKFSLANEDVEYKIPIMKAALTLNPSLRFLSAAWTAPPWMKSLHQYAGYTYLLEKYYQIYADYIVKFLEEYQKNGLEMWTVSTGNEPYTSIIPFVHINSMYWSTSTASKWVIENLGPTLKKSSSNGTGILMLDDQRLYLPWYVTTVLKNHNDALQYVKGFGVHGYSDFIVPPIALDWAHHMVPYKFILMTEFCLGAAPWQRPKVSLGSWSRAEALINTLFQNINHWVVGWVDWNLALDTQGGPNWVQNYVDALVIVVPEKDLFYKQPMYYAMTHFSKFVPRSSIRIETNSTNGNILSTAFKAKDNQIVVLLYNKSGQKTNVSILDERIGSINIELPEYSIHTILYRHPVGIFEQMMASLRRFF